MKGACIEWIIVGKTFTFCLAEGGNKSWNTTNLRLKKGLCEGKGTGQVRKDKGEA